jgi:hypothetical protein
MSFAAGIERNMGLETATGVPTRSGCLWCGFHRISRYEGVAFTAVACLLEKAMVSAGLFKIKNRMFGIRNVGWGFPTGLPSS